MSDEVLFVKKNFSGINLAPQEVAEFPKKRVAKRILTQTSFVFIGLYTLVMIGLFVSSFFFSQKVDKLEDTNSQLTREVSSLKDKEQMLHTLKNRTGLARKVFVNTSSFVSSETFERVLGLVPSDASITGAETREASVVISVSSQNPLAIQSFLESLENAKFRDVAVQTMISTSGQYSVTVHIQ